MRFANIFCLAAGGIGDGQNHAVDRREQHLDRADLFFDVMDQDTEEQGEAGGAYGGFDTGPATASAKTGLASDGIITPISRLR